MAAMRLHWILAMALMVPGTHAIAQDERMTLVLSAPTSDDPYYRDVYEDILDFQVAYARAIAPHDDVVILADAAAYEYLSAVLPDEMLLMRPALDIWVRDFSPVQPHAPVSFRYAASAQGGDQREADGVQAGFRQIANEAGISFPSSPLVLDGGNVVDDGAGGIIVTDRFLEDNRLSHDEGVAALRDLPGIERVAIIPNDDPDGLAHADGMVMFTDPQTLFVNRYDEPFRTEVMEALTAAFPDVTIIELPSAPDEGAWDDRFSSACGIYVNSVVTDNAVYVPQFDSPLDAEVLALIDEHTSKAVVPVPSQDVCFMGGSARCLVWQTAAGNAAAMRQAAREDRP